MPSWAKSYLIAFGSILVGVIILVFWLCIAGLVLFVFYELKIRSIIENFEHIGFRGTIEQNSHDFLLFGGILMFFLILSSISFYAILVKLTWNEVHKEIKKEIDKLKQNTAHYSHTTNRLAKKKEKND